MVQVTVVIVNYNSGDMLTRCVAQVLASTIPVRVIVSDNASTDDSLVSLKQAYQQRVTLHENTKNLGFAAANNAVYELVTTPFILYLNPDCLVTPQTIEHLLTTMEQHPKAAMVGCLVLNPDGSEQAGCRGMTPTLRRIMSQQLKLHRLLPKHPKWHGYLLSHTPLPEKAVQVELISGSCMFARKEALDEVGLLDARYFLYCEDYDWFYRIIQANWQIIFTPHVQVTHFKSHSTKQIPLRVLWYKACGMWRYYRKFFRPHHSRLKSLCVLFGIILRFIVLSCWIIFKKGYPR